MVGILRTSAVLQRHLSQVVEARGVSAQQYNVLRILRGAGPDGLPTLAVRARLIEEAPGITRLLEKLERARLVTRLRSTPDRRQVICQITAEGLALLERTDPGEYRAIEALGARLSRPEQRTLLALLDKLRRSPEPGA
jgi:DNA-binding MarR family transcriptional regulator